MKLIPEPAVADKRNPWGDVFVIKLIEPPNASASISGVTALFTSMVWIISEGIKSIWTLRLSLSADGILLPFRVTEFNCGDKPRTITFLASPWSICIVIPGIRLIASPMFASGNLPTWSVDTMLVIFCLFFCVLRALDCPLSPNPVINTSSRLVSSVFNVKFRVTVSFALTVISLVRSEYPKYSTVMV